MSVKRFDCVQMKNDIQHKLAREYKNLSLDERETRRLVKIKSNPLLKKFIALTGTHGGKGSTACICVR